VFTNGIVAITIPVCGQMIDRRVRPWVGVDGVVADLDVPDAGVEVAGLEDVAALARVLARHEDVARPLARVVRVRLDHVAGREVGSVAGGAVLADNRSVLVGEPLLVGVGLVGGAEVDLVAHPRVGDGEVAEVAAGAAVGALSDGSVCRTGAAVLVVCDLAGVMRARHCLV
jgi:hypothetical protein